MQYASVADPDESELQVGLSESQSQSRDVRFRSATSLSQAAQQEFSFHMDPKAGAITFKRIWEAEPIKRLLDGHMKDKPWKANFDEIETILNDSKTGGEFFSDLLAVIRVERAAQVLTAITEATRFEGRFYTYDEELPRIKGIEQVARLHDPHYFEDVATPQFIKPASQGPFVSRPASISVLPNTGDCFTHTYVLHAIASYHGSQGKKNKACGSDIVQGIMWFQWQAVFVHFQVDLGLEILMACLLTAVAINVHENTEASAKQVRSYGWVLTVLFFKDLCESAIIGFLRCQMFLHTRHWRQHHCWLILPRFVIDSGSMCIVYVIREWTQDHAQYKVNPYRICMVVFVGLRFCRLFTYLQAANWLEFGVSSMALINAVRKGAALGVIIIVVMVAFGTSYHMLPFHHSIGREVLLLFNDGIMGEPSTKQLENVHPVFSLDAPSGSMLEEDDRFTVYHPYVTIFYLAFTIIVFLVFVNLLQGVLGEEYQQAKPHAQHSFHRHRAHMTVDLLLKREAFCLHEASPEALMLICEAKRSEAEPEPPLPVTGTTGAAHALDPSAAGASFGRGSVHVGYQSALRHHLPDDPAAMVQAGAASVQRASIKGGAAALIAAQRLSRSNRS